MATLAVVMWALVPGYTIGWDSNVYVKAMQSLAHGRDPYADGIAVQQAYHAQKVHNPEDEIPYTYVYSPMTLPVLRGLAHLPLRLVGTGFWTLYFAGLLVAIWAGMQFVERGERYVFALLAPSAVFFPGLLQNDVLFSGNIAYILYGLVFLAALQGWKRGRWAAFYAVVLLASCWKAPLLTLLAVPVFSERRQMPAAAGTLAAGLAFFAMQPRVWPELFRHYLMAVDLQFQWNHDFGANPAGVLANALYNVAPYRVVSGVGYAAVAGTVLVLMWRLRRHYLAGEILWTRWAPVLMVAVVLLNPRIMEYDVAAITIPLALVMWRFFARLTHSFRRTVIDMAVFFAVVNAFAPFAWKGFAPFVGQVVQGAVVAVVFGCGVWELHRGLREEFGAGSGVEETQVASVV